MVGFSTTNRVLFELSVLWKSTMDLLNHKVQKAFKIQIYSYSGLGKISKSDNKLEIHGEPLKIFKEMENYQMPICPSNLFFFVFYQLSNTHQSRAQRSGIKFPVVALERELIMKARGMLSMCKSQLLGQAESFSWLSLTKLKVQRRCICQSSSSHFACYCDFPKAS